MLAPLDRRQGYQPSLSWPNPTGNTIILEEPVKKKTLLLD